MTPEEEGALICRTLAKVLPSKWDGRKCIEQMKSAGGQWRQLEWIGWYFEWRASTVLGDRIGGARGPQFGNIDFDYRRRHVWDLKAHSTKKGRDWAILNDCEAIDACVQDCGGIGFIIAEGNPVYDADGAFKHWHDGLKGEVSTFVRDRLRRGARSRKRKSAFAVTQYRAVWLERSQVRRGVDRGWLKRVQEGWRNADGSARRAKYEISLDGVPSDCVVAEAATDGTSEKRQDP